jgi:antitoxin component of RelBE/YafQ-DinJ toxin-antitoxin module
MSKNQSGRYIIISVSISSETKAALEKVLGELNVTQSEFMRLAITELIQTGLLPPVDMGAARRKHRAAVPLNDQSCKEVEAAVE